MYICFNRSRVVAVHVSIAVEGSLISPALLTEVDIRDVVEQLPEADPAYEILDVDLQAVVNLEVAFTLVLEQALIEDDFASMTTAIQNTMQEANPGNLLSC